MYNESIFRTLLVSSGPLTHPSRVSTSTSTSTSTMSPSEPHPESQDHTGQQSHVVGREVMLSPLKGGTLQPVPCMPLLPALVAAVPNHAALWTRTKEGISVGRSAGECLKEGM
ncbi:hypothetical protein E2C01_029272 [Portunus trituberculatus]|uniref:Uncharacterized protein n=1 Tax=Portunus trituberculatus TaxID=210409 RepID=A0A5B7ERJ3_PORTR|nr:hypothetical protein [Portunus trituberculatus]